MSLCCKVCKVDYVRYKIKSIKELYLKIRKEVISMKPDYLWIYRLDEVLTFWRFKEKKTIKIKLILK